MRLSTPVGVWSHSRVPSLHLFIPLTRYHKQPLRAVPRPRPQQAEDKLPASVLISSLSCTMQNTFIPNCLYMIIWGNHSKQVHLSTRQGCGPPSPCTIRPPHTFCASNAGRLCSFARQCGKRKELGALPGIDGVNLAFVWNIWTITLDWISGEVRDVHVTLTEQIYIFYCNCLSKMFMAFFFLM